MLAPYPSHYAISSRRHLPASSFGQAISYTLSNWESLIKYVGNAEKSGVGAVSVVAFTYEIYTIPSQNNGVLRATLTANHSILRLQTA